MTEHRLGIIMNGVTGRMGLNQHLIRSLLAIRNAGGVVLSDGRRIMPDPILVGRNSEKLGRGNWRHLAIHSETAKINGSYCSAESVSGMSQSKK